VVEPVACGDFVDSVAFEVGAFLWSESASQAWPVLTPLGQSPSSCGKLKWVLRHAHGAT
jgi:hypothetical protein